MHNKATRKSQQTIKNKTIKKLEKKLKDSINNFFDNEQKKMILLLKQNVMQTRHEIML
jgi:hypothetical protein